MSVSPAQSTLSAPSFGAPAQTSISVGSSAQGLVYSVSFATVTGGSWLSSSLSQGQAPGVLSIIADPSNLQPGTYQGTVTISSPYTVPRAQTISVTFQVSAPQPAVLSLQTGSLSFSFVSGSGPSSQQVTVSNQGSGVISFTAAATSTGGAWLSVSPQTGTTSAAAPASLTVTATPGNLGAGTYSGSITVADSATSDQVTLPVTMSISAAQQTILLSQTGLSFSAVAQGGAPLPQSFGILNVGLGSMDWTASASTLSGGPGWLSIDQNSGKVAQASVDVSTVNVSINPSGLAAGNYFGQIQVTAPGAANSPQSVSVMLSVLPAGSNPGPEVRPTGAIFVGTPGNNPGSQSVMVANPTASALSFVSSPTYLSASGWLQYLPSNATVAAGQPTKLILQPDLTGLPAGVQRAVVTMLFADGSIRTVSVLTVVAASTPGGAASSDLKAAAASGCTTLLVNPTSLTDPSSSVAAGQPASLQARIVDNCGNLLTAGTVTATFSNSDAAVKLVHVGNGNWSGTWTPRDASQGRVTIYIRALVGQGVTLLSGSASLTVSLLPGASAPVTIGAANAASYEGTYISPGGLVAIYGFGMADNTVTNSSLPLPTQSGGVAVLMGGKPLPLRYVSGNQVNAQVPFDLTVNTAQQLIVQRGFTVSVPQDVVVAASQPGIYTQDQSGTGAGVIVDGSTLVTSNSPAKAGDVVVIYCNVLGAVSPPVPTGFPAPSAEPLARTVNQVKVTIGGIDAPVQFAGLSPGYPDLYQINAVVPAGVAAGPAAVVLTVAGQSSPPVTMAVQ